MHGLDAAFESYNPLPTFSHLLRTSTRTAKRKPLSLTSSPVVIKGHEVNSITKQGAMSTSGTQNTAAAGAAAAVTPPTRQSPALDPQPPPPPNQDTISKLSLSLRALEDSEIDSQSNSHARLRFEETNSYAWVDVSEEEVHLRSLEKDKLKQAMRHMISSTAVDDAVEVRHPFFDLESADLLRLTPYYLPNYLGGIDPRPEGWRESLGVFPLGYPEEVRSYIYPIPTVTSLTVGSITRTSFKTTRCSSIYWSSRIRNA